jgi:hypothetical protein
LCSHISFQNSFQNLRQPKSLARKRKTHD